MILSEELLMEATAICNGWFSPLIKAFVDIFCSPGPGKTKEKFEQLISQLQNEHSICRYICPLILEISNHVVKSIRYSAKITSDEINICVRNLHELIVTLHLMQRYEQFDTHHCIFVAKRFYTNYHEFMITQLQMESNLPKEISFSDDGAKANSSKEIIADNSSPDVVSMKAPKSKFKRSIHTAPLFTIKKEAFGPPVLAPVSDLLPSPPQKRTVFWYQHIGYGPFLIGKIVIPINGVMMGKRLYVDSYGDHTVNVHTESGAKTYFSSGSALIWEWPPFHG